MRFNYWMLSVISMTTLLFLVACGGEEEVDTVEGEEDPIKIGIIGAFEMSVGLEIEDSARLAIEEINEDGGINGREIEAYYYDTFADPEEGTAVVQRLLYQDEVDFIIGEHRSEVATAVQPIIMEEETLYFNVGSASPEITENVEEDYDNYKYTFSPQLNSYQLGEGFINHFKDYVEENDFEDVALLAENAAWVDPVIEDFQEEFGEDIVLIEQSATDAEDFSIELSRLHDSGADAVMTIFSADQGIIFARQWADRQIPVAVAGYNVLAQSSEFWDQTEGNAEGLITWKHGIRSDVTDRTIPFWDSFEAEFGREPGPYPGINTYDSIYVLAEAIEEAGSLDSESLVDVLEEGTYEGAGGIIDFNESHGLTVGEDYVPFTLIQWQDGEMVPVWPEDVAVGETIEPEWLSD